MDYLCHRVCQYKSSSGYCGKTGGYETCQYRYLPKEAEPVPITPYTARLYVDENYSWLTGEIMRINRTITEEIDGKRIDEICAHYEVDTSEFHEWLRWKHNPLKTNADSIRAMTDEELAEWFFRIQYDVSDYYCGGHSCEPTLPTGKEQWLDWLKQEAK